jgi:hypothetical protein
VASQSRKHRGYRSQKVVAEFFQRHGWPFAESTGAGRSGSDVTGVPGLMIEVKARRAFSPLAWLRQARDGLKPLQIGLPFVVFRCDGQGEANVGEWGVLLRLDDMTALLREAGYGSGHGTQEQTDDGPQDHGEEAENDEPLDAVLRPAADLTVAHEPSVSREAAG